MRSEETRLLIAELASRRATDPGNDAILNITVVGDGRSTTTTSANWWSFLHPRSTSRRTPIRVRGMSEIPSNIETFDRPVRLVAFATGGILSPLDPYRMLWDAEDEWAVSWHLSVINGGYPRGVIVDSANVHKSASRWFTDLEPRCPLEGTMDVRAGP